MHPLRLLLRFLFVGSLAANVWLAFDRADRTQSTDAVAAAPSPAPLDADCSRCEQDLETCRSSRWESLARRPFATSPSPAPPPKALPIRRPLLATARVDAELQTAVLCKIAADSLRDRWERDREPITRGIRRSLADPQWREREWRNQSAEYGRVLELDDSDAATLADRYRPVRAKRVDEANAALARDPPDHRAVYEAARRLYADEDALVEEMFGPIALERFRASQLEKRTSILALLATQADMAWTDINW